MKVQGTYLQYFLALSVTAGTALPSASQALHSDRLGNGSELVVVAEPLAAATTVVWPAISGDDGPIGVVTSGDLTLFADLELALAGEESMAAPPVIVAVGGVSVPELSAVLDRLLAGRPPAPAPVAADHQLVEGRLERRLGTAGSDAEIRLEVNLPPPADPSRSSVEVLWELLPDMLSEDLEGVRSRIDGNLALLEARTDSSSANLAVRRLRLGLARIAEDPALQSASVGTAAGRLRVRRRAVLEEHPGAAELLLGLWSQGGTDAVREFLFGVDGVTVERARSAAMNWLPQHPGNAIVVLPPRAFNPRFASPPNVLQLDNGLTTAILERTGAPLATLCLRPVVVPDLDDELAATVLARLARELREQENRPGWVRVDQRPPQIRLAASPDQFSELTEVLQSALAKAVSDERAVMPDGGGARRRALRLMAGTLGIAEGTSLSPAALLRTGNLALGVVAEDGEVAVEGIHKFWGLDSRAVETTTVRSLAPVPKTREAAAGDESVMVVALDFAVAFDEPLTLVVADLLEARGALLLPEGGVEILTPFVPGHTMVLVVVSAKAPLDVLETNIRENWSTFTAVATEDEVITARRRVAAANAAAWSGTTGQACRCAAVASGFVQWRTASDLEMTILSVPLELVDATLHSVSDWQSLRNTGAGVLPIVDIDGR